METPHVRIAFVALSTKLEKSQGLPRFVTNLSQKLPTTHDPGVLRTSLHHPKLVTSKNKILKFAAQLQKEEQNIQQRGFAGGHPPNY
jgi:hypothetical protein